MIKINNFSNKLFVLIFFFFLFFHPQTLVKAETDGYPFATAAHPSSENDGWGFFKRQCTSYIAYKVNQAGVAFSNGMRPAGSPEGSFGNANTWETRAVQIGFTVNNTPAIGAIAQWNENSGGAYGSGHVAWVKSVNTNGTVFIGEYNWNNGDGNYNTRTTNSGNTPSNFIHINGNICGGANVTISNKVISSSLNCSATNSITINPDSTIQPGTNEVRFFIQ